MTSPKKKCALMHTHHTRMAIIVFCVSEKRTRSTVAEGLSSSSSSSSLVPLSKFTYPDSVVSIVLYSHAHRIAAIFGTPKEEESAQQSNSKKCPSENDNDEMVSW
eukprot:CAMPEP_0170782314 /NCGR_PEP_ID=MMETSP0733-20121128/14795_1 /TAXON_ID=186038 /ORGANISM="Fragilariopsis kerguelensis, Strain L26-C5" /LENGTH=104 /DNA_ID=CAMNT_0011126669 /DNA_START=1175 /DNA_END=1486 /DNA_ORIENTATION=-